MKGIHTFWSETHSLKTKQNKTKQNKTQTKPTNQTNKKPFLYCLVPILTTTASLPLGLSVETSARSLGAQNDFSRWN
jgi:hypothetical protein